LFIKRERIYSAGENETGSSADVWTCAAGQKLTFRYESKEATESGFEIQARNFIDYVVDIRMLKAKGILLTTEDKIKDIADTVGYANVNSFIRIFKRVTGLTPKEYRDRKQE
jgi:AraC-like DNA-binding protein